MRWRMEFTMAEMEDWIFQYIDRIKALISPQTWSNALMNCSKNEAFALLFLYRRGQANMTQIADYVGVPLNTATGIINRLEKKELVSRERSHEDKRVVTIGMTDKGKACLKDSMQEFLIYGQRLLGTLTPEELEWGTRILEKLAVALEEPGEDQRNVKPEKKVRKIHIE